MRNSLQLLTIGESDSLARRMTVALVAARSLRAGLSPGSPHASCVRLRGAAAGLYGIRQTRVSNAELLQGEVQRMDLGEAVLHLFLHRPVNDVGEFLGDLGAARPDRHR